MCRNKKVEDIEKYNESSSAESEDSYEINVVTGGDDCPWRTKIKVEGKSVNFKIDTAADVTVIPENVFLKKFKFKTLQIKQKINWSRTK